MSDTPKDDPLPVELLKEGFTLGVVVGLALGFISGLVAWWAL